MTKRNLIRYYAEIAPVMLPYLAARPLNTHRFPAGVDQPGFWQKAAPSHAPDWLKQWHYEQAGPGDSQYYLVPDSVAALAWLANYGALELHAWTSQVLDVERPTWALFDIDPGEHTSFEDVVVLARLHRTALEHLGVEGRPKVTGQRGIQVWVPVEPCYTFAETRAWVETVSKAIGRTLPELVSWAWTRDKRHGLARLDYTQNVRNKTLVAPYSVRPRPGAPVSVPIEWDELDDPKLALTGGPCGPSSSASRTRATRSRRCSVPGSACRSCDRHFQRGNKFRLPSAELVHEGSAKTSRMGGGAVRDRRSYCGSDSEREVSR